MTLARMAQRADTAANWTAANPVLQTGEIGLETDTGRIKIGAGGAAWAALPYTVAFRGARASRVAVQNLNSNVDTIMIWDTEDYDTAGIIDIASQPTRLTVPAGMAGAWRLIGSAYYATHANPTNRTIRFMKNGADVNVWEGWQRTLSVGGVNMFQTTAIDMKLAAGDYLEFRVNQASGGVLAVQACMSAAYLGPA